jgi:hypothetical protein
MPYPHMCAPRACESSCLAGFTLHLGCKHVAARILPLLRAPRRHAVKGSNLHTVMFKGCLLHASAAGLFIRTGSWHVQHHHPLTSSAAVGMHKE